MVDIRVARTALYRLYDADGVLLYVGITHMPNVRFAAHRAKAWWEQVADIKLEWFDTRAPAAQAEVLAIRHERPLYNVTNSSRRVRVVYSPDL